MLEPFAEVPAYPLVFPVFWGAAAFFVLAMARHLRVFAAVRASGPSPFADIPARFAGLIQYAFVQTKMFKDPRAGIMHAGIFWGFVLLTIGTANIVTGGLIQAVISIPFDGLLWTRGQRHAERRRGHRPRLDRLGVLPPPRHQAGAPDVQPRRADHPGDDRRAWSRPSSWPRSSSSRATATMPGAFVATALAVPLRALSPAVLEALFALLWWGHIALVAAFLCYLPFSKHLHIATSFPNIWFRKLAPRGELPALDLEAEDASFGLRTLQDLGWKDLLDGFTCTECGRCQEACPAWNTGQAAQSQAFHHGHPRHVGRRGARDRHHPELADRPRHVRPRRHDAWAPRRSAPAIVDTAIPYDAVWDCVTCGACVEACPVLIEHVDKIVGLRRNLVLEDSRFPQELTGAFRAMENQGNPWGQPASARLDWAKPLAVRGRDRRRRGGRPGGWTSSRSCTGSAARPPSTRATRRSRAPSRPACTPRASASRSWGRRSRARATRRGGWATTTCSRSSRPATSRRSTATGWGSGRSSRPARTASTPSATSTASWAATTGSSITRRTSPSCSRRGGSRRCPRTRRRPAASTGRAASPSTTRATSRATTASSPRRATCSVRPASR